MCNYETVSKDTCHISHLFRCFFPYFCFMCFSDTVGCCGKNQSNENLLSRLFIIWWIYRCVLCAHLNLLLYGDKSGLCFTSNFFFYLSFYCDISCYFYCLILKIKIEFGDKCWHWVDFVNTFIGLRREVSRMWDTIFFLNGLFCLRKKGDLES